MTPHTNILLNVAGSGTVTGAWLGTATFYGGDRASQDINLTVSLTAGTATIVIEGVNDPTNDAAVQLGTLSATGPLTVKRFAFIRARLSAATGATVRVTSDKPLRQGDGQ